MSRGRRHICPAAWGKEAFSCCFPRNRRELRRLAHEQRMIEKHTRQRKARRLAFPENSTVSVPVRHRGLKTHDGAFKEGF